MKKILVPGGAGFIGSHMLLKLRAEGYQPIVVDSLYNGHADAVGDADVIEGDIRDAALLDQVFSDHAIEAVIHFAAFIEAGESVKDPLKFYDNNVAGSLNLIQAMVKHGVRKIVFSSTAAVYGAAGAAPLTETLPKQPINPYGQTKWAVECMLADTAKANGLQVVSLRYFNAAGSDPEGRIGERHDPETHLIPLVLQAAKGVRPAISIFGTDYDTPDGTCIRDYIHVCDLADAHIAALKHLDKQNGDKGYYDAFNLGNGKGFSVREVIETVKRVTGRPFTVLEQDRRPGDPARLIANADRARDVLGWTPTYPALEDMVEHTWHFMQKNSASTQNQQ